VAEVIKDIVISWIVVLICMQSLNKNYNANVPLVLMNSFNTDEDTHKILRKYAMMNIEIHTFNQSR